MKKRAAILLLSLILTALSGCGQSEDTSSAEEAANLPSLTGEQHGNWLQEDFAAPEELTTDQALWAGKYLPVKHTSDAGEDVYCLDTGVCGHLFWYLCQGRESESEYFLEIYDTARDESVMQSFTLDELGLAGRLGYLLEMDMADEAHYVFRWAGYEQDSDGMYRQTEDKMIYTDLAGSSRAVDYWKRYLEKEIVHEETTELPLWQAIDWRCGKDGNICVIKPESNQGFQLCLFDQRGELLLEMDGTETQKLTAPLRTSEGEFIFPVYDGSEKCYEFLWADTAGRQMCSIARTAASYPDIFQMYGMLGNDIYYGSQDSGTNRIVKWNVINGRRELVLDLQEAGLGIDYDILLALRENQTPVLYLSRYKEGQRKEWLTALQEQKPAETEAVRVSNLVLAGESQDLVEACALTASMENPAFSYEYENASEEESRARVLAELTQGKGPDLLLVSFEDMYMLEEKGVLLDIRELLSEELLEELLPGALEIGTMDGKLWGIPPTVTADTLVAGADVWPQDTWRLEDIIGLMDEGKLTCAIRYLPSIAMGKYMEPALTVLVLVRNSLADSFLIDWENRKCHFDDERFIRLLELCSTDLSGASVNTEVWLNEGKDVLQGSFYNMAELLKFYEHIGTENGRTIGYPTGNAGGSYLTADGGVLAVSAGADPEEAAYFLETLLGREIQSKTQAWSMSVRRPVPEYYITEESGKLLYKTSGREMPVFADGDNPFLQAEAFLESCAAAPFGYSQIKSILIEEIRAMYAENKSPRATAELINNRVQLYLDEGN